MLLKIGIFNLTSKPLKIAVLDRQCLDVDTRVVLDSFFFRADSILTHMTIQVTQLRLNSNPKFANLTQLRGSTQNPNLLT